MAQKSSRRVLKYLFFIIVIVLICGVAWRLWHKPQGHGATGGRRGQLAQGGPPQAVRVATVATGDIHVSLDALGAVTPLATITVVPQISGILTEVGFTEGQLVKQGDFLAEIDPRPYQVALEQAQGALARDQATLAGAQRDLQRFIRLEAQDSIARQQVDDQRATVQQDQGAVRVDQAAIDSAKLNLVYCHITSPVAGRVGLRLVDPGNFVQTSSTGLVVVTQLQPISVVFTVPEDDIAQVVQHSSGATPLAVTALDRAGTTVLATGSLSAIDNQVDTTTGTVKLRATFANTDDGLFPNQFVNAKLALYTLSKVVTVPIAAIQNGAPGTYAYLVGDDDKVSVRPIKEGPVDGEIAAVTSGLEVGDKVVIDGADRLKDGAVVTIAPDQPANQQAAGDTAGQPQDQQISGHKHHKGHHHKPQQQQQQQQPQ
jgi:multidrug efflux system membrane fusion protein